MTYAVKFDPEAYREYQSLDGSVKKMVYKQIEKLKERPQLGEELGNKAGMDLTGYRKLYVNKKQIRIVYRIEKAVLVVVIVGIGKREDMEIYRQAAKRVIR